MTTGRKPNDKNKKKTRNASTHPRPARAGTAVVSIAGFLARHGYGGDRLRRSLGRLDWRSPDARQRVRAAIALYADTVLALLVEGARDKRRKLPTFVGDLLSAGDPGERPWLWLALQRDAATWASLSPDSRQLLAASSRPLLSHVILLDGSALPVARLRDVADIDADTLLAIGLREAVAGARDTGRRIALASLLPLTDGNDGPRAVTNRLRQVRRELVDEPVTALDHRAFRKLPPSLRRPLLFTPDLAAFFLDTEAQAAARPPSPGFDPLFLDRAIDDLARGRLEHVDVDTLVLGSRAHPALMRRATDAILTGQGTLRVDDEVRERLIACAAEPALCLAACAAARSVYDMRRALSQLAALPQKGTLADALHRLAPIAWRDALPQEVPPLFLADDNFRESIITALADTLADSLAGTPEDAHLPATLLFRHLVAWLATVASTVHGHRGFRVSIARLDTAFGQQGSALATEIDGNDLHALYRSGETGARLARTLADALRAHNPTRWEHGFFARLVDADPDLARAIAGDSPRTHEIEALSLAAADGARSP